MTVLGSDAFYVVRAATVIDPIGQEHYLDWANATETLVSGANVQPFVLSTMSSKEENRDRQFEQTLLRIYAPASADILYTDRIRFGLVMYDVFGSPNNWRTFSGAAHHIALTVRLREG